MASPVNPNHGGGGSGGPFDVNMFFNNNQLPPAAAVAASYPPPTGNYNYPQSPLYPQFPNPYPNFNNPNPNHNHGGARLMALLSAPQSTLEVPPPPPISMPVSMPPPPQRQQNPNPVPAPLRMPSSKLPNGRHLVGDRVHYDIDVRLPGEVQPQLEVTPITKYGSDPCLVLGRQIAVNKNYICYGLKGGNIRVLNINTALRSLLKGLTQRLTDMAFFAEDVHLLACTGIDGRVYVWKITEGPGEDEKDQITGKIVVALQILGEGEVVHPRVCWHCHKQEVLVVGIGRRILRIDTTKFGKGEVFSAEEPLNCHVEKLIDGVQFVGSHDGEVTDLSMCQWMTSRLVSASVDGTVKIWGDRKQLPIAVLRPHDGLPVSSVTFVAAPHRPDHIILITGGPLNREVKLWASESEEGWLLPSDSDSWHCIQTMELKSSAETRLEDAFFNQVVALSQAGLLLLANAKKNAIYAVHLEYGPNPEATRMDYVAEFTVAMPILSFTGTSELLPHGEQIVQVYCVQTQAIQQYALDLSQCLPPPIENVVFEKPNLSVEQEAKFTEGFSGLEHSGVNLGEIPISSSGQRPYEGGSSSAPVLIHPLSSPSAPPLVHPLSSPSAESVISTEFANSSFESKSILGTTNNDNDIASSTLPSSPRLSRNFSGFKSPSSSYEPTTESNDYGREQKIIEYSVDRQIDAAHSNLPVVPSLEDDSRNDANRVTREDSSSVLDRPTKFKQPTHLITPSEILMGTSSSEFSHLSEHKSKIETDVQDVVVNSEARSVEVEVKVVGETGFTGNADAGSQSELQSFAPDRVEKSFCSQASDLGIEMSKECIALQGENFGVNDNQLDESSESKSMIQLSGAQEEVYESSMDDPSQVLDSGIPTIVQSPASSSKGKKQKGKINQGSVPSSPSPSGPISNDSSNDQIVRSSTISTEAAVSQIQEMHEMLSQLTSMQKAMQKQMSAMVTAPVTKEGKRLETALGKSMEKAVKANADALWTQVQEEFAKQEKSIRERTQQITGLVTNCLNKDLPAMLEKIVKKEVASAGPAVARTITPVIEKSISTAITDAFQKGVGDKAVSQLERAVNSKLEATVARQIQAQFQTSGKQALQETLKSSLESSVVPAFEMSCKAMFDQVDAAFQRGMVEHTSAAQQLFESAHTPLANALRDAVNSISSATETLNSELADGQRKLIALAAAGANPKAVIPLVSQISNGPLGAFHEKIEVPFDPTIELSRLVFERKYEEAFTKALQRSDLRIVSWLCSQVDLQAILNAKPIPLSQGVLLSLLQQLSCDLSSDTPRKLSWMTEVAVSIKPTDQTIAMHVTSIYDQVYSTLSCLPSTTVAEHSSIRILMSIIRKSL